MRAFFITEPGSSEVRTIEEPKPGPGEILLRTRIIGLCGSDLNTFRGLNPLVSYPRIPGHEIAATIAGIGEGVPAHFQTGTSATVSPYTSCGACASCLRGRANACRSNQTLGVQRDGAMTEYFLAPWQKIHQADGLSLRDLSFVEPLSVGFHAATRGRVAAGDTVAVLGCGTVGLGAIAAAALQGATVIAVDLDERKLETARRAGASLTINGRIEPIQEKLREYTHGHGPDVIIEAVGSAHTFRLAVEEVAFTGRVVYVGYAKEPVAYETKLFVQKELDVLGSRNSLTEFPAVIDMLKRGSFPIEESISRVVPLDGAGDALRAWSELPQAFTKILVEVP